MPERDPKTGVFLKGKKGGPGRPKGSRNKLGEAFLDDFYADWKEHGAKTIGAMRQERPAEYVKVAASLLPKELIVKRPEQEMSDEELADTLERLHEIAALLRGSDGDHIPTHGGSGSA